MASYVAPCATGEVSLLTEALLIVNAIILGIIYLGAIEILVTLGVARHEARWWYMEAFCRGIGRIMGDPPAGDPPDDDCIDLNDLYRP